MNQTIEPTTKTKNANATEKRSPKKIETTMSHFNHDSSREQQCSRQMLRQAMQNCDELVVEFDYEDAKGNSSHRVVSPIRFVGADRMLGLCLSREEPRQFYLSRCRSVSVRSANEYVMPVPMRESLSPPPSHEPAELPASV